MWRGVIQQGTEGFDTVRSEKTHEAQLHMNALEAAEAETPNGDGSTSSGAESRPLEPRASPKRNAAAVAAPPAAASPVSGE